MRTLIELKDDTLKTLAETVFPKIGGECNGKPLYEDDRRLMYDSLKKELPGFLIRLAAEIEKAKFPNRLTVEEQVARIKAAKADAAAKNARDAILKREAESLASSKRPIESMSEMEFRKAICERLETLRTAINRVASTIHIPEPADTFWEKGFKFLEQFGKK